MILYHALLKMETTDSLSTIVVDKVAAREDVSPCDLHEPLYDVIDPEALDALFATVTGQLQFEYHGYKITADSNGTIDLTPLAST